MKKILIKWISNNFPEVFSEGKVFCYCDEIKNKNGLEDEHIILNTLNALTIEFSLYFNKFYDLPWWNNEAPLTGFLSTSLVRQFDAINLHDFCIQKAYRPDLLTRLKEKSILFETKLGKDIKDIKVNDNYHYHPSKTQTYKIAMDQVTGYSNDTNAGAEYWCVLYFAACEFLDYSNKHKIVPKKIIFDGWTDYKDIGLPFSCRFIIDSANTKVTDTKEKNYGKYYPLCYLWGNICKVSRRF